MARLEESLLTVDEVVQNGRSANAWQRIQAWALPGVVTAALAMSAFIGGAEFGRQTTHQHGAYGVSLTQLKGAAWNATALVAGLNLDCYMDTGGTCGMDPCYPWRGAECRSGRCLCEGTCTGADGKCYDSKYKKVADGFTLTNVKWPDQKMFMPGDALLDSVRTTGFSSWANGGEDKFILYQLPGNMSGHTGYFLSSWRFSGYVVSLRGTTGTAVSPYGAYEVDLDNQFGVQKIAVRVCSMGDGKVKIGGESITGAMEWFYLHHFSWIVYGWGLLSSDPGDGGVWKVDPPIPEEELEPCD